ncbi:hypothetical protein ACIG5E_31465 [Kitasatospora sp. NPDC053057]|uniref:hypothetical protein n=1 Tax=Kitasatospora sp. NPDC053057 TaxID=3364062 RepID=UPI0037CC877A
MVYRFHGLVVDATAVAAGPVLRDGATGDVEGADGAVEDGAAVETREVIGQLSVVQRRFAEVVDGAALAVVPGRVVGKGTVFDREGGAAVVDDPAARAVTIPQGMLNASGTTANG